MTEQVITEQEEKRKRERERRKRRRERQKKKRENAKKRILRKREEKEKPTVKTFNRLGKRIIHSEKFEAKLKEDISKLMKIDVNHRRLFFLRKDYRRQCLRTAKLREKRREVHNYLKFVNSKKIKASTPV